MSRLILLLIALACCGGCTSVTVEKAPSAKRDALHRIFVVQPFNENHHIDEMFVDELVNAGCQASSGPLTMMPEDTQAVLTYDSRWTWDFKTYLIELTFQISTAHTDKPLAAGRYYQPSARPRSPEEAVHELVQKLFASLPTASPTKATSGQAK